MSELNFAVLLSEGNLEPFFNLYSDRIWSVTHELNGYKFRTKFDAVQNVMYWVCEIHGNVLDDHCKSELREALSQQEPDTVVCTGFTPDSDYDELFIPVTTHREMLNYTKLRLRCNMRTCANLLSRLYGQSQYSEQPGRGGVALSLDSNTFVSIEPSGIFMTYITSRLGEGDRNYRPRLAAYHENEIRRNIQTIRQDTYSNIDIDGNNNNNNNNNIGGSGIDRTPKRSQLDRKGIEEKRKRLKRALRLDKDASSIRSTCPVCMEFFYNHQSNAKNDDQYGDEEDVTVVSAAIIPCQHAVCLECLRRIQMDENGSVCPICRKGIEGIECHSCVECSLSKRPPRGPFVVIARPCEHRVWDVHCASELLDKDVNCPICHFEIDDIRVGEPWG